MSRNVWLILIATTLCLALAAAAAVTALVFVPRYRATQSLATARQFVSEDRPDLSRPYYKRYLYKNGDDVAVLEEYLKICEVVIPKRRLVLGDAARFALARLVRLEPANEARKTELIDYYRKYRFWDDLESTIKLYYGNDYSAMDPALAYDVVVARQERGSLDAPDVMEEYIGRGRELRDIPLRLARTYAGKREQVAADQVFPPLLKKYPDDGMLRLYYAAYLLDQNKSDEAASHMATVPASLQDHVDYSITSIRLALAKDDFEGALAVAEKALASRPDYVDLQLNYILALERSGRRQAAMEYIQDMDPVKRVDTPGFIMFLAELYLESGNVAGADEARELYMRAYPEQYWIEPYLSGRIALARKSYKDARDKFVRTADINPGVYRASYFLALCELELHNMPEARIALERYKRSNPTDQKAQRLWTRYFDTAPSLTELQARSDRLLAETEPEVDTLLYTVEDLLNYPREASQQIALRLMEKVIALAPRDPRGYGALAGFHLERDEVALAEKVLQDAAGAGVNTANFALIQTGIFLVKGDKAGAMATAQAFLEKSPSGEAQTWAAFFAGRGYFDESDELVERFGGEVVPGFETGDALMFRLSLALQYGRLDAARARLAEAEASRGQNPELLPGLNRMRLALAEGLVVNSAEVPQAEVDGLLAKVRKTDPQNDSLKIVEARMLLRAALPDVDKAMDLVKLTKASPVYLQALQIQAEIASMQGHNNEVEDLCKDILAQSSTNTQVMLLLADAQLELKNWSGARETLELVLAYDRDNLRAMRLLVHVYEVMKLTQLADETFERFAKSGGDRPEHAAQVEELRTMLGRTGSAPAPAVAADDTNTGATNPYAAMRAEVAALAGEKRFPEAVARVNAYLKLEENKNQEEAWAFLGQVILAQGEGADLRAASKAFTHALVIVPDYGPALLGNFEVSIRRKNLPEAESVGERYLRIESRDVDTMYRLATVLAADPNRREKSLEWVGKAIDLEERPLFFRFRAFLLTQMGRQDEAIEELTRLIGLSGTATAEDELFLAEAYLGKDDRASASEHLAAAAKLIPEGDARLTDYFKKVEGMLASEGAN